MATADQILPNWMESMFNLHLIVNTMAADNA